MSLTTKDRAILRDAMKRYMEIATSPIQERKRKVWLSHNSRRDSEEIPILAGFGMHNVWCREYFSDAHMFCESEWARHWERHFKMSELQFHVGDDHIQEPWISVHAAYKQNCWGPHAWGFDYKSDHKPSEGGAYRIKPAMTLDDLDKVKVVPHEIDEEKTKEAYEKIKDIAGDIIPVGIYRGPAFASFNADISTTIARLLGLEEVMEAMIEDPDRLHMLLAKMRDGILAAQDAAEAAGDYTPLCHNTQGMPYVEGLAMPAWNAPSCRRNKLVYFCAAQEMAVIGPAQHEEFMFQYQRPISDKFGAMHYGCCEDLTDKMDSLRKFKTLYSIAVAPLANLRKCAERIGRDYVLSWRPNPSDVSLGVYDHARQRKILEEGFEAAKGSRVHLNLKDVETVTGDVDRLRRWVALVRDVIACRKG